MPNVFVANYVHLAYDQATKYGELKFITRGYIRFDDISSISLDIAKILINSKPEDFLILSGNNLVCLIVGYMWMSLHGSVNILHWDTKNETYTTIKMIGSKMPVLT